MMDDKGRRNRVIYGSAIVLVVCLGLASRACADCLPAFLGIYAGDTLWGLMSFLGLGFIFNQTSTKRVFIIAITFCFSIELSQIYQTEWLNLIRGTTIGGLILGYGFVWSDLLCYLIGISVGTLIEKAIKVYGRSNK